MKFSIKDFHSKCDQIRNKLILNGKFHFLYMPSLLLLEPSKGSKTKGHTKAPGRRRQLWTDGHTAELLKEGEIMQNSPKQVNAPKATA